MKYLKFFVENMILDLRFKTGEKKSLKYKDLKLLDMLNFQLRCDMDFFKKKEFELNRYYLSSMTIFFFIQVIKLKKKNSWKFNILNVSLIKLYHVTMTILIGINILIYYFIRILKKK
jgi:hypothetical protein